MKNIKVITIKLPFGLNWLKKYIRLEVKTHKLPKMKGQHINSVILDEWEDPRLKDRIIRKEGAK